SIAGVQGLQADRAGEVIVAALVERDRRGAAIVRDEGRGVHRITGGDAAAVRLFDVPADRGHIEGAGTRGAVERVVGRVAQRRVARAVVDQGDAAAQRVGGAAERDAAGGGEAAGAGDRELAGRLRDRPAGEHDQIVAGGRGAAELGRRIVGQRNLV